ncbi:hypothetical protein DFH06DRAFT_1415421 [Mycena polygramma]|nr:hypothetical protein DFH06DRAFT_1415421 [Mycena polygramma]
MPGLCSPTECLAASADFGLALAFLAKLIYSLDDEILIDAWAISYLSDGTNDKIQAVIESGLCRRLMDLLVHHSTSVRTPALRDRRLANSSFDCVQRCSRLLYPNDAFRVNDADVIPPMINVLQTTNF